MKILITGSAGFIGFHLALRVAKNNEEIYCLDNINCYYDTALKYNRLEQLGIQKNRIKYNKTVKSNLYNLKFIKLNLEDKEHIFKLFKKQKFDLVIHLAAQAGVRYSSVDPYSYMNSNITGFFNIVEACRIYPPKLFLYASSSSVYGLNKTTPFLEHHKTEYPASLYAATKKTNELLAHTYSYLYSLPTIGIRFFSVYGPWGRPDMAYYDFTHKIISSKKINVYNFGKMKRDYTYIDDAIDGILNLIHASKTNRKDPIPFKVYNIGNNQPIPLLSFIHTLEKIINKRAIIKLLPIKKTEVLKTYADINLLYNTTGVKPKTTLKEGLTIFLKWYKEYHRISL